VPAGAWRERPCQRGRAQAAFGDALTGVEQVEAVSMSATAGVVDAHLDMLRPAITSYGATVQARARRQRQALLEHYAHLPCLAVWTQCLWACL